MLGPFLSRQLKRGKLRFLGKPLYNGLIELELAWIRHRDRNVSFEPTPLVDSSLTAIIKTFERPHILKRLIDSLLRFYPHMKVIVADDSRQPFHDERVKVISLPYDSGVSAGRQAALEAVTTPYVLVLDDDFIFYAQTRLEAALHIMEKEERIDLMGGEVVNLPSFQVSDSRFGGLYPTSRRSVLPAGSRIAGLEVCDKIPNFYIARTERLKLVGWDRRIKRIDHADFFTRAKGVLVTVYNPAFKVLHAQTPFLDAYLQKRYDINEDKRILQLKYYAPDSLQRLKSRQETKR